MAINSFYNRYHNRSQISENIVNSNNFTYYNAIRILDKYLKQNSNILDIGCGVGVLDFYLTKKGNKVFGIDVSSKAIKVATESARLIFKNNLPKFSQLDFLKARIKIKFDVVIMFEVLEHLKNDKKAIQKINSLLKKNGLLILSSPSNNAPLYKLGLLDQFDKDVGHLRRYSRVDLIALVEENGFKFIDSKLTEGVFRNYLYTNKYAGFILKFMRGYISDIAMMIDNFFVYFFGESQIYIVAQKT